MASSGNFCTLNPLVADGSNTNARVGTIIKGNLHTYSGITDRYGQALGTHGVKTGKWYTEWYISEGGYPSWLVGWYHGDQIGIYDGSGVSNVANFCSMGYFTGTYIYLTPFGNTSTSGGASNRQDYSTFTNQGVPTTGDVIMNCMDFDAGKGWWGINGVWGNSGSGAGDPANGSNPNLTWTVADYADHKFPITLNWTQSGYTNGEITFNAGQDSTFSGAITAGGNADGNGFGDFKYSVPSGFLALCSANLTIADAIDPAQTDDDYVGGKQFNVLTYTGNGSTQSISNLGFKPDLVWIKSRSNSNSNELYDSSRGATKRLRSDTNDGEDTRSSELTGFTSDGFSLGSSTYGGTNYNSYTYVAWCWRCAGGVTSSNTNGDITTTVQANQDAGFSIFTYTGNGGGAGTTMGHGLSQAPDIWFLKQTSNNGESSQKDWRVMLNTGAGGAFRSLNNGSQTLKLNSNSSKSGLYRTEGNFEPTSTVVQAPNNGNANAFFVVSGNTYVSYCWHSVEGYSKFGSYEGNGNADGPFIYTGFRPRLVFVKALDATENWQVRDTARSTYNADSQVRIYWNSSSAEGSASTASPIDFLANGFKVRGSNTEINGDTMVYGAWGDVPFKYGNTFG